MSLKPLKIADTRRCEACGELFPVCECWDVPRVNVDTQVVTDRIYRVQQGGEKTDGEIRSDQPAD
jgi:hypothetical protein